MMNEIQLGNLIKSKRLERNLTMDNIASEAGVSRQTIGAIEKGQGNCSISTLLKIMNILDISISINDEDKHLKRERASRINSIKDKKINRFVIMCVEQYALSVNKPSSDIYKKMNKHGIINELEDDYEYLHGMSTIYLNDYIDSLLSRSRA